MDPETVKNAVLGCSELVTLAGPPRPRTGSELRELAIIADGAMLIEDDRIDTSDHARKSIPSIDRECEVIDAGGRVVLPGFVDAHTHPVFAGNRAAEFEQRSEGATYAEIAAAGGGIRSTVRPDPRRHRRRSARRRSKAHPLVPARTAPPPSKPNPATASHSKTNRNCCA